MSAITDQDSRSGLIGQPLSTFLRAPYTIALGIGMLVMLAITLGGILANPVTEMANANYAPPSLSYPCGTDGAGRDVCSMIVVGYQQDLEAAGVAMLLTLVVGGSLGAAAGCCRPLGQYLVLPIADFLLRLPPVVIFFVGWIPLRGMLVTYIGLGALAPAVLVVILCWPAHARLAYGVVRRVLERRRSGVGLDLRSLMQPTVLLLMQLLACAYCRASFCWGWSRGGPARSSVR